MFDSHNSLYTVNDFQICTFKQFVMAVFSNQRITWERCAFMSAVHIEYMMYFFSIDLLTFRVLQKKKKPSSFLNPMPHLVEGSVTGLTCTMFFIYTATSTALAKYFAGDVINLINCMLG